MGFKGAHWDQMFSFVSNELIGHKGDHANRRSLLGYKKANYRLKKAIQRIETQAAAHGVIGLKSR